MDVKDALIRHLRSTLKCGTCRKPYPPDGLQILGHQDELWFVHVHCSVCGSRGMVAAVVKLVAESQEIGDLTLKEIGRFQESVTADDILEMHNFLKDFQGDLKSLLR